MPTGSSCVCPLCGSPDLTPILTIPVVRGTGQISSTAWQCGCGAVFTFGDLTPLDSGDKTLESGEGSCEA